MSEKFNNIEHTLSETNGWNLTLYDKKASELAMKIELNIDDCIQILMGRLRLYSWLSSLIKTDA